MMEEKKSGRLQSLKLPRDLSLGISKAKKQYAPNLNVVRNKDKPKELVRKTDQKRKETRIKKERIKDDARFQQSVGVFSQGSGDLKRPTYHRESYSGNRENSGGNLTVPVINKNAASSTVSKKPPQDAFMDDSDKVDFDSEEDEKMSFVPLTICLDNISKTKKEVLIKKEDNDICIPFDSSDYTEDNPALSLVKLPDSFAGKGLSDDPNVKKLFDYPLSCMLEGQIGKLVIRKSGKMEMQIGRIIYELSAESMYESKEELASIREDQNGQHYIAILGKILNNFIMYPCYDSLLKKS